MEVNKVGFSFFFLFKYCYGLMDFYLFSGSLFHLIPCPSDMSLLVFEDVSDRVSRETELMQYLYIYVYIILVLCICMHICTYT